jgi:hypothetical protein
VVWQYLQAVLISELSRKPEGNCRSTLLISLRILSFPFLAFSLNLIILLNWFIVLTKLTLVAATLDYGLRPEKLDISSDTRSKDVGSPSSVEFLNRRGGIASVALLVLHHDLFPTIGGV